MAPHSARRTELATLLRERHDRYLAVALGILRDLPEAEDALQDACVHALRALDRFEGRALLSTWVHRLVVNAALMRLRGNRRRRLLAGTLACVQVEPERAAAPVDLDRLRTRARVRDRIAALPAHHQTVLRLRDFEELDVRTAARRLGVTSMALKMRHHRARLALRSALSEARGRPTPD